MTSGRVPLATVAACCIVSAAWVDGCSHRKLTDADAAAVVRQEIVKDMAGILDRFYGAVTDELRKSIVISEFGIPKKDPLPYVASWFYSDGKAVAGANMVDMANAKLGVVYRPVRATDSPLEKGTLYYEVGLMLQQGQKARNERGEVWTVVHADGAWTITHKIPVSR